MRREIKSKQCHKVYTYLAKNVFKQRYIVCFTLCVRLCLCVCVCAAMTARALKTHFSSYLVLQQTQGEESTRIMLTDLVNSRRYLPSALWLLPLLILLLTFCHSWTYLARETQEGGGGGGGRVDRGGRVLGSSSSIPVEISSLLYSLTSESLEHARTWFERVVSVYKASSIREIKAT